MNRRLIYVLVGVAFVFFVTSLVIFLNSTRKTESGELESVTDHPDEEIEEARPITVKAFFYKQGSWYMTPLEYEIPPSDIREELYRSFIDLLIQGAQGHMQPVPEGVGLRTLYFIEKKGLLLVDFSEELISQFPGGTRAELEFIYFIVDNLCYNFKEIKMVKFLVAGNEYHTLSGHIDIQDPFYPDYRYLRDR
jgi:hypothetical protein